MSYGHGDLQETQGLTQEEDIAMTSTVQYSQADYTRLTHVAKTNIKKIGINVQDIKRTTDQLGTAQDTPQIRDRLHEKNKATSTLAKTTAQNLKKLRDLVAVAPSSEQMQQKIQNDRLTSDFKGMLDAFRAAETDAMEKERQYVAKVRAESSGQYSPGGEALQYTSETHQLQQQADMSAAQLEDIKEREDALRQLESDIMDVNQIFKDLASMVEEQGEVIDSIETNVTKTEERVVHANTQLVQAAEKQSSSRKKKVICAVIVIVVLAIIGLAIGLSF